MQLLLEPHRHRGEERAESEGRARDRRLEQAFELEERLLVEHDRVELRDIDAAFAKAVLDRAPREAVVVLSSRKALLLRRGHDATVADQGRRAVVVEG